MVKTIYLHIGTHKTGTTAIQKFSAINSDSLAEKGMYYPISMRPDVDVISFGHHLLPWLIRKHPVPDHYFGEYASNKLSLFEKLLEEINAQENNNILISSEEFDGMNETQIGTLKDLFASFEVQIIIYLRRKDEFVEAMYQTAIIGNYPNYASKTINEFIESVNLPLNYFEFIGKWQKVFGIKNVKVHPYCKKVLLKNDIIIDFYSHLGVNVESFIQTESYDKINSSIPFHYVSLMVMFRRMGVPENTIRKLIKLAKTIGEQSKTKFHFLATDDRMKLAYSGLDDLEKLNLGINTDCFIFNEVEDHNKNQKYRALQQFFDDLDKFVDTI